MVKEIGRVANEERDLLNPPSRTNQPHIPCSIERSVQSQQPPSPLNSQNLDLSTQPSNASLSTLGQRAVDQVRSFPVSIAASSTPIRQINNVFTFPSPRPIDTFAQNVTATETDSEENFNGARNTLRTSIFFFLFALPRYLGGRRWSRCGPRGRV